MTAIAICARFAAARGAARASVARNSALTPDNKAPRDRRSAGLTGSMWLSLLRHGGIAGDRRALKAKGPDRHRRGPREFACRIVLAHANTLGPHGGNAARLGRHQVYVCANHEQLLRQSDALVNNR